MPQLDKFTFGPQVVWLVVLFFALYFVLLRTGLPRVYKILLFRRKKLEFYSHSSNALDQELFFLEKSFSRVVFSGLKSCKQVPDILAKVLDSSLTKEFSAFRGAIFLSKQVLLQKISLDSARILRDVSISDLLSLNKFVSNKSRLRGRLTKG